jgi:beta-lactamase regulating signal transducer with metallopeptidase domain
VRRAIVSIPLTGIWTALLIGVWSAWSLLYGARILAATSALYRSKRECCAFPEDRATRLRFWAQREATGRRTGLVLSNSVRSAAVLGFASPLIAVTPGLLDELSDEELDQVVIHEWAHVQRHDDLLQLLQLMGRVIAGWHPALWWLDRQLHLEREVACDEVAVAITGSPKRYAACLAKLAQVPVDGLQPLPAVGALSSSTLRPRIVRILRRPDTVSPQRRTAVAFCASLALVATALTIGGLRLFETRLLAIERAIESQAMGVLTDVTLLGQMTASPAPERNTTPTSPKRRRGVVRAVQSPAPTNVTASSESRQDLAPLVSSRSIDLPTASASTPSVAANNNDTSSSVAGPATFNKPVPPWSAAANAGIAVGRGSQDAALATAGFFTRFGRTIANSF